MYSNYEILQNLPRQKNEIIEKSKIDGKKRATALLFVVIVIIMEFDWTRLHVSNTSYNLFNTLNQTGNVDCWRVDEQKGKKSNQQQQWLNMEYFLLRNLSNAEKEELRHRLMDVLWTVRCFVSFVSVWIFISVFVSLFHFSTFSHTHTQTYSGFRSVYAIVNSSKSESDVVLFIVTCNR